PPCAKPSRPTSSSPTSTKGRPSREPMERLPVSSSPISISGRAPSGSPESASLPATVPAIGKRVATTTTPTHGKRSATAEARKWLRAIHRDVGYIAVGLTFIYALSGIAVNHITDWSDGDPSFKTYSTTHHLDGIKNADDVLARLAVKEKPREIYQSTP